MKVLAILVGAFLLMIFKPAVLLICAGIAILLSCASVAIMRSNLVQWCPQINRRPDPDGEERMVVRTRSNRHRRYRIRIDQPVFLTLPRLFR